MITNPRKAWVNWGASLVLAGLAVLIIWMLLWLTR
jgi:hypothetical protein